MLSFTGFIFSKTYNYLKSFWISKPTKHISQGEQQCKHILEDLYPNYDFISIRPKFLRNPETGKNLELDCYNSKLKLAVEYQGEQHYRFNKYYHNNIYDFYAQLERDMLKQRLCVEEGIKLIVVPYSIKDIRQYLVWILSRDPNLNPNKYKTSMWNRFFRK